MTLGLLLFVRINCDWNWPVPLYASRGISRGLGARLAGMEAEAFEAELHSRCLSNGLGPADLDADLAVLDNLLKS
jgi:predicted HTH domain antitoxin